MTITTKPPEQTAAFLEPIATTQQPDDVVIELFTADPSACTECSTALEEVDLATSLLSEELTAHGRTVRIRVSSVADAALVRAHDLPAVPTVRINGADLGPQEISAALIVRTVQEQLDRPAPAYPPVTAATTPQLDLSALASLRAAVRGAVHAPGESGWDRHRGSFNLRHDQRPTLVALPADAADAATLVQFAIDHGLRVAPQRTGHNAGPLGDDLSRVILLRTDAMTDVRIDADLRLATVGAGAKWESVVPLASGLGLAALHGSTGDVGVVGYTLGGGVGWYGRTHGLAANSVTRIQLLTPDGRLRWVDQEHEPDLFWALRGGGGSFGIVTALQVRLYPVRELYAGAMFFPWERSAEVLKVWRTWTEALPETVTSVGRFMQFPDEQAVPEPLRGRAFVFVEAFILGSQAEGEELTAPIRALGPLLDTFAMRPPAGIAELHMDPPDPLPYVADHLVLGDVTPSSLDALVEAVGPGSGSPLVNVEIRHLGGALSRVEPTHGALARMPGEFLLFGVGVAPTPEDAEHIHRWLHRMKAPMAHLESGAYYNFSEHQVDPGIHYSEKVYERLQRIRAAVDPHALVKPNHDCARMG